MRRQVQVLVGIDMTKTDHYAQAIHVDGIELFSRPVLNNEATITKIITEASVHGR